MAEYTMSIRRRVVASAVVLLLIVAGLVLRLVDVQVVRADGLVADSLEKMGGGQVLYANRGSIVDTNGQVLAESVTQFHLKTSPKDVTPVERRGEDRKTYKVPVGEVLGEIGTITGQPAEELQKIIDDALAKDPKSNFAYLAKSLDADQRSQLRELKVPWLWYEPDAKRMYPNGAVAGNLIGFVGSDNTPLAGIELKENGCLVGRDGREQFQSTKEGVPLPGTSVTTLDPVPGGTLGLTIDRDLNWYMQQLVASQVKETKAEFGIVMVTEAKTGKIRAVAEYPTVDPNDVGASDPEYRSSLAFRINFEPGSVYKAITAASLVDSGVANHLSEVVAPYRWSPPNGASIKDALPHEPQNFTLSGVLQQSSNTGLAMLGEKLSPERRYDYLEKFGFGAPSGIDFPGEESGALHDWKKWDNQSYYTTMFGQGVSTTAVQIAGAYQALANDGVRLPLQLIEGCERADGSTEETPSPGSGERVISAEAAQETRAMMETVVTDGFLAQDLTLPGYRVAAKSGTGEQFDADGKLKRTFFASMAGMVPSEDPEYVVTVHLKDPLTKLSSAAAAPVFTQAITQVIKHYGIPPSTEPAPDYPGYF